MRLHLLTWLLLFSLGSFAQQKVTGKQITLLFAGDIMGHTAQIASAKVDDNVYDYEPCFKYIAPLLKNADLALGNLELTLPGAAPYKGYPMFRSPGDLALALSDAGFDVLFTANNHSNDGGRKGLVNTIQTLRSYDVLQTGTFIDQDDKALYYPLIVYKNDFKLIFLNYTYGTNGLKTKSPGIVNMIDQQQIKADIEESKQYNPDAIIVMMHWGSEYQLKENGEQQKLAAKMLDWGADHIIGAHPHVVQPFKLKKDSNGLVKNVIVYSLGNFISDQKYKHTDGGAIFQLTLEKNAEHQNTSVVKTEYMPVYRYRHQNNGKTTFHVLPISVFQSLEKQVLKVAPVDITKMKDFRSSMLKRLKHCGVDELIFELEKYKI